MSLVEKSTRGTTARSSRPASTPAAFLYEKLGWSVIPVNGTTKRPLVPWEKYTRERPTLAEIQSWGVRFGSAGIAVITGPVSQIVVLDADGAEGVEEAERLGIPKTPTARTPRGGAHYYFKLPAGFPAFKNAVKLGDSRKLDVRGHAGYVVAPHTSRADGKNYKWVEKPDRVQLAPPPSWFLKMLNASPTMWASTRGSLVVPKKNGSNGSPPSEAENFVSKLPLFVQTMIREGHDLSRFASRSECDFAVIVVMLVHGANDELIESVFSHYLIGEKYREPNGGLRYLNRTIDDALQHVRVVRIKYADPVEYEESQTGNAPGGARLQLALIVEEGPDVGRMIRCGITLPDASRSACAKRWERFFQAIDVNAPNSYDEVRATSRSILGKRLRIELGGNKHQVNPVAGFHQI